jgi:hypothetical protein
MTVKSPTGVVFDLIDQGDKRHVQVLVNDELTGRTVSPAELDAAGRWVLAEGFLEHVAGLEFNS